ncbi:unnamed protein product [Urochloa humidicola]
MRTVPPSARPSCGGVPRPRALVTKPPRVAAPSARGVTMPRDPSACRAGAGGFCATKSKIVNGVQVEVEAIVPVGLGKPLDPAPVHHRSGALARATSACLTAVEVVSSVPTQKRSKRTCSSADTGAEVLTATGDPARDRLRKRMASELEALREILKKAELIARGLGKSKRVLPGNVPPRPEQRTEAGGKTPSVKRRKVSPLPENEQKQRMTADERNQLAGRLASLAEVPNQIVEFLQKRLGGGDADEIVIDFDSAEDSVLFELQALLDQLAAEERPCADAVVVPKEEQGSVAMEVDLKAQSTDSELAADEIRSDAVPEQDEGDIDICGGSDSDLDSSSSSSSSDSDGSSDSSGSSSSSDSGSESDSDEEVDGPAPPAAVLPEEKAAPSQPPPEPAPAAAQSTKPDIVSGGGVGCTAPPALLSDAPKAPSPRASEVAQSAEPKKKVQDAPRAAPKEVSISGALYKAKTRRQLQEMERAVVPDESIQERDLRRLRIAEYGRPGIMRQLGLYLKADA